MFAPVSQSSKSKFGDDIDLSDIFAEYLNDAEDPLTTFSNYSAYSGNATTVQQNNISLLQNSTSTNQQQQQQQQHDATLNIQAAPAAVSLPTGRGIKTAFHTGGLPGVVSQIQSMPQEPAQKRPKVEVQSIQQHQQQEFRPQAVVPANISTSGMGITGRLGLSVAGGQVSLPPKPQTPSNLQLPVGVGIRVGGLPQANNGMQVNHVQWGGGAAAATTIHANTTTNGNGQFGAWAGIMGGVGGAGGGISEQAMQERRQRNREHAKRSRVRKKFLLESLQAEVTQLQDENKGLRMLIQQKIPQHAAQIIDECCIKSPLFGDDEANSGADKADERKQVELVKSDFSLIESLTSGQQNFVLSDPRLPDNPIVFASEGFYQLTGYTREQVLGRNCRFLQGPGSDPKAVDVIRTAVANGTDATTCILNYKADGTPFWNQFFVAALRDSDNCIVNYVGVQCAVEPDAGASALEDKVNSVLPLQQKAPGDIEG